ncbi:MAG: hypothetical protein HYV27_10280 [Candidatus Hydrogenedentes bacterium]|nr:hypothetical protein [Candidatus Hydrogenedentota bacterium]
MPEETVSTDKQFECAQCGASLTYTPGTAQLDCAYCGHSNPVPVLDAPVQELDFHAALAAAGAAEDTVERITVRCGGCGAASTLDPHVKADTCPFCGTPHVQAGVSTRVIKPKALLPFKVERAAAGRSFSNWLASLWFAPSALTARAQRDGQLQGIYIPYWTYDCHATTQYTGQRGEHYWVTEHYTEQVNGKSVQKSRQVRHTRWYPASGTVRNTFDDILILASASLPREKTEALEPWDLDDLQPYQDHYLSGFKAESYQIDLEGGFGAAKERVAPEIHATICSDIGGDEQRVHESHSVYSGITFKHLLLPVWISAYRFKGKVFRFVVNGRTGEVQGERPWSWVKITLAVLAGLAAVAMGYGGYELWMQTHP